MSDVQNAIQEAANRFAHEVVSLLRGATLADILELAGRQGTAVSSTAEAASEGRPRRRGRPPATSSGTGTGTGTPRFGAGPFKGMFEPPRGAGHRVAGHKRSAAEVSKLAERVLAWLGTTKKEVGVSAIAEGIKVPTAALSLPLSKLRRENKVVTTGQKRSTVYRIA